MNKDRSITLGDDIKEFAKFFTSLWGIFSGGAILFPFINKAVTAIPAPNEEVKAVAEGLSMLGSAFIFLIIYFTRRIYLKIEDQNINIIRKTKKGIKVIKLPFAGYRTIILSCIYFVILFLITSDYLTSYWEGYFEQNNIFLYRSQISGVLEYVLIFMFATISFSTPAAAEYIKQLSKIEKEGLQDWPHQQMAINAINERLSTFDRVGFPEVRIISEKRSIKNGGKILEILAFTRNNYYEVTIDANGKVLNYLVRK